MEMQWVASQGNAEVYRARVPGGWLVFVIATDGGAPNVCFYPDPEHEWEG